MYSSNDRTFNYRTSTQAAHAYRAYASRYAAKAIARTEVLPERQQGLQEAIAAVLAGCILLSVLHLG
jgi:hypothetical protein